ncbi:MAG: 2Fe-2S iron-sulfur cluster-binding protein [Tissierellia bacterium]|nr:2Fe-2S iron-sulfur cluster-binding protein [Tissierellia bacterium]
MNFNLKVNGESFHTDIAPDELLFETLRKLGFYSVKCGCDTTNCGLCTVIIDDLPYLSCSMLTIRCGDKEIYTLEGLYEETKELRDYIAHEGGEQCGFCSPGFIMNVVTLKRKNLPYCEDEVAKYLSGNLCRCTGYSAQMRAVKNFLEG